MDVQGALYQVLPFLGAGAMAYVAYQAGQRLADMRGRAASRVAELAGVQQTREAPVAFGSEEHRLRLAFRRFGLNVAGRERFALNAARIGLGVLLYLVMGTVLGFPPLTSLIGLAGGWILMGMAVEGAWNSVKQEIEREIPLFLTGLSTTVQVTPNVLQAVEDELRTLKADGALQTWLRDEFLPRCQRGGFEALDDLTREAFGLSSSLGIVVFLIGRLWKTGGKEWESAFEMAGRNLEGVLDARVLGQATGSSARGSVRLIAVITFVIMVMILRTPSLAETVRQPVVQFAYGLIVLMMLFGYGFMNKLIDEAF